MALRDPEINLLRLKSRDPFDFARAIEAEARKDDEALILQLVEALEGSIAITMVKIDQRNAAITAGRAWLEGKPCA